MKMVYICSPLRGDIEDNIKRATQYCEFAVDCGVMPLAPHVAWNGVLDDNIPKKRELALKLGLELLHRCDEVWVMGRKISHGMRGEIEAAQRLHIPVIYMLDEVVENNHKLRQDIPPLQKTDCITGSENSDYTGKILMVAAESLMKRLQTADNSLWIANHGTGCLPGKNDRTVHVTNLYTGAIGAFGRYEFYGVVKPESLTDWLRNHPVRNDYIEAHIERLPQKDLEMEYVSAYQNGKFVQLFPSVENLAAFVVQRGRRGDITMTDPLGRHILDTYMQFINKCSDKVFLEEKLKPILISMQLGEVKLPPIHYAPARDISEDTLDEYSDFMDMGDDEIKW